MQGGDSVDFDGSDCSISPRKRDYQYLDVITALKRMGFEQVGQGGFGVILASNNCVIKLIKDISRCDELSREKSIYQVIEQFQDSELLQIPARVPRFHVHAELDRFCHFNMERIFSPFSGYGAPEGVEDDEEDFGHGYVIGDKGDDFLIFQEEDKRPFKIDSSRVYLIGRPGNLVHFYVNHFDPNLRERLDEFQGVLFGMTTLERVFGPALVADFAYQIGQLLAFLVFVVHLVPVDVEVVIASVSQSDRRLVPFIYDFNESSLYSPDHDVPVSRIARAMHYKNGKNYFPNSSNPYFPDFAKGFLATSPPDAARRILDAYSKLFS